MERYEGRCSARRRNIRSSENTQTPKKYFKNFGRQLFIASLCLSVIFFAKDIDNPNIRKARDTVKYAVNYNIDFEWVTSSLTAFFQNRTNPAPVNDDVVPAAAQNTTEDNPNDAKDNQSPETQF